MIMNQSAANPVLNWMRCCRNRADGVLLRYEAWLRSQSEFPSGREPGSSISRRSFGFPVRRREKAATVAGFDFSDEERATVEPSLPGKGRGPARFKVRRASLSFRRSPAGFPAHPSGRRPSFGGGLFLIGSAPAGSGDDAGVDRPAGHGRIPLALQQGVEPGEQALNRIVARESFAQQPVRPSRAAKSA